MIIVLRTVYRPRFIYEDLTFLLIYVRRVFFLRLISLDTTRMPLKGVYEKFGVDPEHTQVVKVMSPDPM